MVEPILAIVCLCLFAVTVVYAAWKLDAFLNMEESHHAHHTTV